MLEQLELVDPCATSFQPRPPAAPLASLAGQPVALVDMMLNPSGGWGQALLDGVEDALRPSGARFGRERRKPLRGEDAGVWAAQMAAQYRAAVIAAGD